jgi:predicted dehydrogenase
MTTPLRVGIIGVSADGGWARDGHVPAVQGLAGLELAAIAASNQEKADAAAKAFGVKAAFASGLELIGDPDIDVVAVCVRVPDHRELVMAAIAAGKHIYCEWPLGKSTAESEEMAASAEAAGICTTIGLQARANPAAIRARDLILSGAIGRVLSAHVYSSTAGFGPIVPAPYLYLEDPENGVNMVTIQGAHTIDTALLVVGAIRDISSLNTTQYPEIEAGDDHKKQARITFDHMLVQARLAKSGVLSMEVAGGRPAETPFRLRVVGDKGTLALDGGAPRGFQSGRLRLTLNGEAQPVDEGEARTMPDSAANVSGSYAALRDDINQGTSSAPDFHQAVLLSRLMDREMESTRAGTRVQCGA